jgi:hypothetical protein
LTTRALVDYTVAKNIKRAPGGFLGMVTLTPGTVQTVWAKPSNVEALKELP